MCFDIITRGSSKPPLRADPGGGNSPECRKSATLLVRSADSFSGDSFEMRQLRCRCFG